MTASGALLGAAAATSRDRRDARALVIAAARELFTAAGVRRTTMEHVARRVGTSRQTVYKLFLSRKELVEAALAERIGELAEEITAAWPDGDLATAFVEISVAIVEAIRSDAELRNLLGEGSPITLHEALWMTSVRERNELFWRPWFARARAEGRLRDDVTEAVLCDWIETVYGSVVLRADVDRDAVRHLVERFVLPSILRAPGAGDSA